ncbi:MULTISPECIES: hypothetical protein [Streptomyces]|uniref:hypothetical protein n=1 Tax=Streptomyces TaxID=1883 RepID=UPI000AAD7B09|nr:MULTISPECIES: hypothetical protein [Streptomyces]
MTAMTGGGADAGAVSAPPPEPSDRRPAWRRVVDWFRGLSEAGKVSLVGGVIGLIAAIVAAIIGAVATVMASDDGGSGEPSAIPSSGPDFAVSVELVRLEEDGFWAATGADFQPSSAQSRFLARPMSSASKEFTDLLRSAGAVNVEKQTIRLTLTGRRGQQVNVLDIHPVIVRRTRPLDGTLFSVGGQEGSPTFKVMYDLDRPNPVARKAVIRSGTSEWKPGPPFFADTTITLHRDEQNVVVVRATAERFYVAFRLDVTYMLGDRRKHMVIDDHGRPFQVTGVSCGADGRERYRRVFGTKPDYSMHQNVGLGAFSGRLCGEG